MDTPTSKPRVEFKKSADGYDATEVDDFVASVRAELAELHAKVRQSGGATGRSAVSGGTNAERLHDPDRAVERMLGAAQQTADRVVYEAEAEAERVLAEADEEAVNHINSAEEKAEQRLNEAESQGERIRKEAVTEARRVVEETRQPLAREVKRLRETRDSLRQEIDLLRGLLSEHREKVRDASDALRELADNPDVFRVADPGPRTEVTVNVEDDFEIDVSEPETEIDLRDGSGSDDDDVAISAATPAVEAPNRANKPAGKKGKNAKGNKKAAKAKAAKANRPQADRQVNRTATQPDGPVAAAAPAVAAAAPRGGSVFSEAIDMDDVDAAAGGVSLDELGGDEISWSGGAPEASGRVITGAFADQLDEGSGDALDKMGDSPDASGDGFLTEVRKAVVDEDTAGLGEVDEAEGEAISSFFEKAIDEPKSRFGRRTNK